MNRTTIVFCFGENDNARYLGAVIPHLNHATCSVLILQVGHSELTLHSFQDSAPRLSIATVTKNNIDATDHWKKKTFGQRIMDLLTLESIVGEDRTTIFVFNNFGLGYLAEKVKENPNCMVITFCNSFACEPLLPASEGGAHSARDHGELQLFRISDLVLCYTEDAKRHIEETYGTENSKLMVWRYGGQYLRIGNPPKDPGRTAIERLRQKMLLGQGTKVITYFNREENDWGVRQFLAAIHSLLRHFPATRIILTDEYSNMPQLLADCAPDWANFIFTGRIESSSFAEIMAVSDIMVTLPGIELKDNFLLNVLISGQQVITTTHAAPRWIRKRFEKQLSLLPLSTVANEPCISQRELEKYLYHFLQPTTPEHATPGRLQEPPERTLFLEEKAREFDNAIRSLCKVMSP